MAELFENTKNTPAREGNTKPPSRILKRAIESKYWTWTINFTDLEMSNSDLKMVLTNNTKEFLDSNCDYYIFSLEMGETTKRLHFQGFMLLTKKKTMLWLKNHFNNTAHLEKTIGNKEQNIKYISKKPIELYEGGIKFDKIELPIISFKNWHNTIIDILNNKPDNRTIHVFIDPIGGIGKSEFGKWLMMTRNTNYTETLMIPNGKTNDICNLIYKLDKKPKNIIVDIPRTAQSRLNYDVFEQIKNGYIVNYKFETGHCIFNIPNLIIFTNNHLEYEKLSKDRWKLYKFDKTIENINTIELNINDYFDN